VELTQIAGDLLGELVLNTKRPGTQVTIFPLINGE
jgi:hypothetical protein